MKRLSEKRNPIRSGFKLLVCASEYVRQRKNEWGSNLVGWVDKENGKWVAKFNIRY